MAENVWETGPPEPPPKPLEIPKPIEESNLPDTLAQPDESQQSAHQDARDAVEAEHTKAMSERELEEPTASTPDHNASAPPEATDRPQGSVEAVDDRNEAVSAGEQAGDHAATRQAAANERAKAIEGEMTPAENTEPQSTPETDDDGQVEEVPAEPDAEASPPAETVALQNTSVTSDGHAQGEAAGSRSDQAETHVGDEPSAAAREVGNGDADPAGPEEDPPVPYDAVKAEHEPVDARTALEGQREVVVKDPADPGRTITDIDHVDDGVLWEEKSATWAGDEQKWVDKQVTQKLNAYLDAREHMPGYEDAPIGVRFTEPNMHPTLRRAVEGAVAKFRQDNPDVDVRLEIPQ